MGQKWANPWTQNVQRKLKFPDTMASFFALRNPSMVIWHETIFSQNGFLEK